MQPSRLKLFLESVLILLAFGELIKSDAYYMPYLLICVIAFVSMFALHIKDYKCEICTKKNNVFACVFSLMISIMITLANYKIWNQDGLEQVIWMLLILVGVYIAIYKINILVPIFINKVLRDNGRMSISSKKVFVITSLLSAVVNFTVFWGCKYPGQMSPDSIDQIYQMFGMNTLSNHHPFYHTMAAKLIITLGLSIFDDLKVAIALFFCVQIIFMALSFGYSIKTVAEIGAPKVVIVVLSVFMVAMPFNIMYSFTFWKDVPFGIFILINSVSLYRVLKKIGAYRWIDYLIYTISGIGICLFRGNGFISFVLIVSVFLILFKLKHKVIIYVMLCIIVISYILKYPVLEVLNVNQPALKESLSIPLQQIARVVRDANDLSAEEVELLNKVLDVDRMGEVYLDYISDPEKNLLMEKNNQNYIKEHKIEFFRIWLNIGLRHMPLYIQSYIDQTKGYWNSGYEYWRYNNGIHENSLGIERVVFSHNIERLWVKYMDIYNHPLMQVFVSIGVYTWLLLGCLYINLLRRDMECIVSTLLPLAVIATLLLATPIFAEFRYTYSSYVTMPVLLSLALYGKCENAEKIMI